MQRDEWIVIGTKMIQAVKPYQMKFLEELGSIEEDASAAWTNPLDLMKRP